MKKIREIKPRKIIPILISFNLFFLSTNSLLSSAQLQEDKDSNCVLCAQVVPECKENEKLILQTCEKCAHCEPIAESTKTCKKCKFNFECPRGNFCKDECCVERTLSTKGLKNIKKIIEHDKSLKSSIPPTDSIINNGCKNPCGDKCCNLRQKCIVIDQCKERKTKCSLPVLKYCSTKTPEQLKGRIHPLL